MERQNKITRLSTTLNLHAIYGAQLTDHAAHLNFHKIASQKKNTN